MYLVPQSGQWRGSYGAAPTSARRTLLGAAALGPRRRHQRRFAGLGQVADPTTAAIAQFCPAGAGSAPCNCTVDTASIQSLFEQSVQSRYLLWPPPDAKFANCSGVTGPTGAQTASKVIGSAGALTATGAIAAGAAAGSVVPVVGTIVGAIGGLIAGIFGAAHAKAVAAQNSALCTAVPSANAALQQIDAGLSAGTITPAQALDYYQQIGTQFTAAMKAGTSYKQCDALYAYNLAMEMVLAARTQDLQAAAASGGSGAAVPTGTAGGIPAWALLAGGALLFFALK